MALETLLPFLIALITIILIVIINVLDDKVHTITFIFGLVNALAFLAYMPFYNKINDDWFNYLYLAHNVFSGLFLLFVLLVQIKKVFFFKAHYQVFINSIKASE